MDAPISPPAVKSAARASPIKQLSFKASNSIEEDDFEANASHQPETDTTINKVNESIDGACNNNNSDGTSNNNSLDHPIDRQDQQVSKIKLKRCKHGRIIIKDLSKKKLTHHSPATNIEKNVGSHHIDGLIDTINENHGINELYSEAHRNYSRPQLEIELEPTSIVAENVIIQPVSSPARIDSNYQSDNSSNERQYKTPPRTSDGHGRSSPRRRQSKSRSPAQARSSNKSHNHSPRRSRVRSRSGSRSYSRSISRGHSPPMRKVSLERRQSRSPHRRRDGVSSVSRRNRSPRGGKKNDRRSLRRTRERSPAREKISVSSRHQRSYRKNSPSPGRHRSHDRSLSPKRDKDISKRRRDISISPVGDRYVRNRYRTRDHGPDGHSSRRYDSIHSRRFEHSPISDRRLHEESPRLPNDPESSDNPNNDSRGPQMASSSLGELLSVNQQLHQQQQSTLPKPIQLEPASPPQNLSPAAQSPSTPFNDDSASSDIYDPAGPIISISPGDSPPLSSLHESSYQDSSHDPSSQRPTLKKDITDKDRGDDDVIPSSAVQLNQQEKYLQKLNRQERVIEEVKLALKPHYSNRTIDKEQYKDVLRRAVPKICHNKNGEINPIKIRSLVEAYVKKMKHH